ncbi:hypothetical protein [Tahibacter amnicola]|uniref:ATP synthase subunit delta n=1 Tax=Tahibacter amnicola TaxID=2976241 RepID=A0ABY6BLT9_9GAMM|nr:hypothetical protein [Tahibacter amnicola]UXI70447.1 hypothetical protein N4264_12665 [Tahibacter amnicola]
MSQNLLSLVLTDAQLAEADAALDALERALDDLISLTPDERRGLNRMGPKSEVFCRQVVAALQQNPQIVPPKMNVAEGAADLVAIDRLRPRLSRLLRITERADDTVAVLGSDVMSLALEGYAQLKVSGRNEGLDGLRKELSSRFRKSRSGSVEPTPA